MTKKLTPKQERFVQEYLLDLNITKAAIRAGYTPTTADKVGYQLLGKTRVSEEINKAMEARSVRTEIKSDNVLQEIAKLGFANIKNIFDKDGKFIPVHKLPPEVAASLVEVTERIIKKEGDSVVIERKYKLADKKSSLELLGKHLKLFTDKIEHNINGKMTLEELIASASEEQ